jgi:hypothetical protein
MYSHDVYRMKMTVIVRYVSLRLYHAQTLTHNV